MEESKIVTEKDGGSSGFEKTGTDARKFEVTVTGTGNGTWQGTVRHNSRESAFQSELELIRILSGCGEAENGKR